MNPYALAVLITTILIVMVILVALCAYKSLVWLVRDRYVYETIDDLLLDENV